MKEWNGGMVEWWNGGPPSLKLWWIKNNGIMENAQVKREYI